MTLKSTAWYAMTFLALAISSYAVAILALPSIRNEFLIALFAKSGLAAHAHLLGGAVALAIGPFQLSSRFRSRHLSLHRLLGKVYVGAVLIAGLGGLSLAVSASGGLSGKVGFGMMAVVWLICTTMAFVSIRSRRVADHQVWMIRSYAVTLSAVTLRVYLPISIMAGYEFAVVYPVIAWFAWVPNLLVADWFFVRRG